MRKIWYIVAIVFNIPFLFGLLDIFLNYMAPAVWSPIDIIYMIFVVLPWMYVMVMLTLFACKTFFVFAFYSVAFGILAFLYYIHLRKKKA